MWFSAGLGCVSLHDALPISPCERCGDCSAGAALWRRILMQTPRLAICVCASQLRKGVFATYSNTQFPYAIATAGQHWGPTIANHAGFQDYSLFQYLRVVSSASA